MRRSVTTILAVLMLATPLFAHAQRMPQSRHVGSAMVGEARLELFAFDDGTVIATANSPMVDALASWHGEELRTWLDTAAAVLRHEEVIGGDRGATIATPITGIWLVRQMTAGGSSYVLSVISPASGAVLDARPSAPQIQTLLRALGQADSVMRDMTGDSLPRSHVVPARRAHVVRRSAGTVVLRLVPRRAAHDDAVDQQRHANRQEQVNPTGSFHHERGDSPHEQEHQRADDSEIHETVLGRS